MIQIDQACIEKTTAPQIKFEEKRAKIIFRNPNRKECLKIQIDGCAIKEGIRCDNLLKVTSSDKQGPEYYVELKGGDVEHAVNQIIRTIQIIHNDSSPIMVFVICSNVKPIANTNTQRIKLKLKRQFNANCIFREHEFVYNI